MESSHKMLVRKLEGKISLGRPKHRWEGKTEMDIKEIIRSGGCIHVAQDRDQRRALANTVINLQHLKKDSAVCSYCRQWKAS
jgi:hypothetical protein